MIQIKKQLPFDLNQAQEESLEEYLQPTPELRRAFTIHLTEEQQATLPYSKRESDDDPARWIVSKRLSTSDASEFIVEPVVRHHKL
jgi:hypothetical protein